MTMMADDASILEQHYPQSCPFCNIAAAYPAAAAGAPSHESPATATEPSSARRTATQLDSSNRELLSCVPRDVDTGRVTPDCFLVLSAPRVLAFLDIMPMTKGHLLVTIRAHRGKLADVRAGEGADVGFWLPLLAKTVTKVTNTTDYNIVQNNGARAAQVVPHVHFHIIPRPASMPELANKSWTMFGRGQREDLDDDDAAALAAEMRRVLQGEIEALGRDERGKL